MLHSTPWLNLPDDVTEKVLERLPLSDYVRFPAVCRRWRSIQVDHRLRYAPSPPPMLNLPWIIWQCKEEEDILSCYSPFEDRSYRIRIPNQPGQRWSYFFDNGWLFRYDAIMNPISGVVIPFTNSMPENEMHWECVAAMLPPPDHLIFVVLNSGALYLCRQGGPNWTRLILPQKEQEDVIASLASGGKLYCICSRYNRRDEESRADHLVVIDPLQVPPAVSFYRMADWSNTLFPDWKVLRVLWSPTRLVESGGEVLLVKEIYDLSFKMVRYQVFRPDLVERMWRRVECLGDRLLILNGNCCLSLLAADVGLRANCIYFSTFLNLNDKQEYPWQLFDLGAETVTEVAFPNALPLHRRFQHMFMPCIC